MGEAFRKPDRHNNTGYYEDLDWRNLNKMIINRAGGTWYNPPNPEDVDDAVKYYKPRIETLVELRNENTLWGFKDPRTIFTIHALEQYLPDDVRYVRVSRNTLDVVQSLSTRASIRGYKRSDTHWYSLIRRYNDQLMMFIRDSVRPLLSIEYEKLLYEQSARDTLEGLASFCGLDWRDTGLIDNAVKLISFREQGCHS